MLRPWRLALRAAFLAGLASSISFATDSLSQPPVPPDPEVIIGVPPDDYYSGVPGYVIPPACDYGVPSCDAFAEPGCLHVAPSCNSYTSCCDCRCWTIRAEAIIWDRVGGSNVPLVGGPVPLSSDDLDFDWAAGPRLTFIRHGICGSCWDLEAAYFGIDGWSATADLADIDTFLTDPTINVVGVTPGTVGYGSTLDSFELNFRRGYNDWLTWFIGFRMLEVGEELTADFNGLASAGFDVNNHLYGGQLGLDAVLFDRGGPFYANLIGKAGIYGNSADSVTTTVGVGGALPLVVANGDDTAFVGELSLLAGYRLTERMNIVGGYNLLWIDGVALAPDQLATTNIATGVATVDTSSTLFYHGFNVGLEYYW